MQIRPFDEADTEAVVALWGRCGLTRPWNDPRRDIERKLTVQRELFLVGVDEQEAVLATAMAGYDGHRGWVHYVAVDPAAQGTGAGRQLMAEVERRLLALGCPKLSFQVRTGNERVRSFYEHLGYSVDDAFGMGKRLIAD
jgi:ribosomal protein S18 acetylase RimI-like enzyme